MGKLKPFTEALKDSLDSAATYTRRTADLPNKHRTKLDDDVNRRNETDKNLAGGTPKPKTPKPERIPKAGKYSRPSGYRKGVRDKVWDRNQVDGVVKDPLTGRVMDKNKPWDMGHLPKHEFRKAAEYAEKHGWTRKEFLDWHNNPDHSRPELPSSNRSHKGEDPTDAFDE